MEDILYISNNYEDVENDGVRRLKLLSRHLDQKITILTQNCNKIHGIEYIIKYITIIILIITIMIL